MHFIDFHLINLLHLNRNFLLIQKILSFIIINFIDLIITNLKELLTSEL
jgi:hypothetical protein